jgi:response regulator RpfG family c-di-GMP phosphodiesterase
LGSRRSFKEPWSEDMVTAAIREGRGTQFEPALVDLLLANLATFNALRAEHPDLV